MPFNMTQRLLCAAQHTYLIDGTTDDMGFDLVPELPHAGAIGYQGPVAARQSLGYGIDAALVGVINEGVVVAVRGTLSPVDMRRTPLNTLTEWLAEQSEVAAIIADWINNGGIRLAPATFGAPPNEQPFPGRVHAKFAESFDRLWPEVSRLVALRAPEAPKRIYITGHSKGGALAALFAWAFAKTYPEHKIIVRAFAPARVGDVAFAAAYNAAIRNHVQFAYATDLVPHLPGEAHWLQAVGFPPSLIPDLSDLDPGYGVVGQFSFIRQDGAWLSGAEISPAQRLQVLLDYAAARPGDLSFIVTSHALSPSYASGRFDDLAARLGADVADVP